MTIKTEYVLRFIKTGHNETICEFTFNTTSEVKLFVKKMSNPGLLGQSADDAHMILLKRTWTWNLEDGNVDYYDVQIEADF